MGIDAFSEIGKDQNTNKDSDKYIKYFYMQFLLFGNPQKIFFQNLNPDVSEPVWKDFWEFSSNTHRETLFREA